MATYSTNIAKLISDYSEDSQWPN